MDSIKFEHMSKPKMIAHRGLSGVKLENSLEAFILAAQHTYYGVETDIHVTLDKKFVTCHDSSLLRTSGFDLVIENTLYDDLRAVKLNNGEPIPNLMEYLNACKNGNKVCVIELKEKFEKEDILSFIQIINDFNYKDKILLISFDYDNIQTLVDNSDYKCQILSGLESEEVKQKVIDFAIKNKIGVDVYFANLTKEFVDICHENNVEVNVYTVDKIEDAHKMIEYGVDYITSNILE